MANINAKELRRFPLVLPPKDVQASFAEKLAGLADLRRQKKQSASAIDRLFQVLIHRAFAGRLTAAWRKSRMNELLQEMQHQAKALG